jgi:Holliday junction resolvase
MANANKRKGDRAERELAALLTDALGTPVRRQLGAGRTDDIGDLDGVSNHTLQVKNWRDITAAIRVGIDQLKQQQTNAKTENGTLFIKHAKHGWLAVQTLEQWTRTHGQQQPDAGMGNPLR